MKPEKHIFVCIHDRPPGDPRGSCAERGARKVLDTLKGELFEAELLGRVKASGATCLGNCEHGVVTVTYPEAAWYKGVSADDAEEIVSEHLDDGEPLERLAMPDEG